MDFDRRSPLQHLANRVVSRSCYLTSTGKRVVEIKQNKSEVETDSVFVEARCPFQVDLKGSPKQTSINWREHVGKSASDTSHDCSGGMHSAACNGA